MAKKKQLANIIMTDYDKVVVENIKASGLRTAVENKEMRNIARALLLQEVTLKDGTRITPFQRMVVSSIQDAIENPAGFSKVKDAMHISGELKEEKEVNIQISLVDKDLKARSLGKADVFDAEVIDDDVSG